MIMNLKEFNVKMDELIEWANEHRAEILDAKESVMLGIVENGVMSCTYTGEKNGLIYLAGKAAEMINNDGKEPAKVKN